MSLTPLLKWPGGKRLLVPHFLPHLPEKFGTYFEPFAGGAALFFRLLPDKAVLSDKNDELINCYVQVRDQPVLVLEHLRRWENTELAYLEVRSTSPTDPAMRAARLIYLVSLSFNGIHRVNLQGRFNVPYGKKGHILVADEPRILACSKALQKVTMVSGDFEETTASAQEGDLVYFDPPYTVAHGNNGFVKYNDKIFTWADQERLLSCAKRLKARGVHVLVSNADHSSIRDLYADFRVEVLARSSNMASRKQYRHTVTELLLH